MACITDAWKNFYPDGETTASFFLSASKYILACRKRRTTRARMQRAWAILTFAKHSTRDNPH
eukprot:4519359-Amphidinium_carterae.1